MLSCAIVKQLGFSLHPSFLLLRHTHFSIIKLYFHWNNKLPTGFLFLFYPLQSFLLFFDLFSLTDRDLSLVDYFHSRQYSCTGTSSLLFLPLIINASQSLPLPFYTFTLKLGVCDFSPLYGYGEILLGFKGILSYLRFLINWYQFNFFFLAENS